MGRIRDALRPFGLGRLRLQAVIVALVLCAWGCAGQQTWSRTTRAAMAQTLVGRTFELRHTQVVGAMYDDNERELLSPYPFEEVFHHVDLLGAPIHPTRPRALIPAGTAVTLVAIDYPGPSRWLRRMLATPHEAVWLQLQVTGDSSARPQGARLPLIMPLPRYVRSAPALQTALNQVLAPVGEVSRWLAGRSPATQVAIAHKEAVVAMGEDEMTAALGPPWRWLIDALPGGESARVAWYPHQEVWLRDKKVLAQRPSRHAP